MSEAERSLSVLSSIIWKIKTRQIALCLPFLDTRVQFVQCSRPCIRGRGRRQNWEYLCIILRANEILTSMGILRQTTAVSRMRSYLARVTVTSRADLSRRSGKSLRESHAGHRSDSQIGYGLPGRSLLGPVPPTLTTERNSTPNRLHRSCS
jgi:hypothetical protein